MSGIDDLLPDERILEVIIIILIIYVIHKMHKMHSEKLSPIDGGYLGGGLGDTIYTSGATMRRLSQKFSDTSQGQYMVIHNDELSADERQGDLEVIVYPRFSGVNTVPAQGRGY